MKKESRKRIWLIRLVIFMGLLLLAEISLRILGYKAGQLYDYMKFSQHPANDSILLADENGITYYNQNKYYKKDGHINRQGFIGDLNYTPEIIDSIRKSTGKKIIMLIGDSFTDGCCSDSVANSFYGILNKSKNYFCLNFGIPGTDPVQYQLIIEKYAGLLKPDLVVCFIYLGNDIMMYDRTPKPFIPACYVSKDGSWFNSEIQPGFAAPNSYLKSFDEAYTFNENHFSLNGENRNLIEKVIGKSVIFSKIYLLAEYKINRWNKPTIYNPPKQPSFTNRHMQAMVNICNSLSLPLKFVPIPSPSQVRRKVDIRKEFDYVLGHVPVSYCDELTTKDYDGKKDRNHFNNKGHKKMAIYLHKLILNTFK